MGNIVNKRIPKEQRLGQEGFNNQGLKMTIKAYRNNKDIDVQFEDGAIVEHRRYDNFVEGKIAHPKPKLGETNISNQGFKMTIIAYRNAKDIDVQFEDGVIVEHRTYGNFARGLIAHPMRYKESLGYLYPHIAQSIAIPENNLTLEDTKKIPSHSVKRYYTKCLNCGEISKNKKVINDLTSKNKIPCNICGDSKSLPEKFMYQILKQLNINFTTQYSPNWNSLGQRSYDFYIPSVNMIIETHGEQHFKESFSSFLGGRTLEEEQQNDKEKREIAIKNGIINYLEIDCSESTSEFLQANISLTLEPYFDLSSIDWMKAWRNSQKSLKVETRKLHDRGYDKKEIAEILGICERTVIKYLKDMGVKNKYGIYQDNLQKTLELLQQGYSKKQIEKELQVCIRTVEYYISELKSQGLLDKNKFKYETKQSNFKKTLELLQQGYSKKQIAEELQISIVTVYNYISELKFQDLI